MCENPLGIVHASLKVARMSDCVGARAISLKCRMLSAGECRDEHTVLGSSSMLVVGRSLKLSGHCMMVSIRMCETVLELAFCC